MSKLKWTDAQKLYLQKLKDQHSWDTFGIAFVMVIFSALITSMFWAVATNS